MTSNKGLLVLQPKHVERNLYSNITQNIFVSTVKTFAGLLTIRPSFTDVVKEVCIVCVSSSQRDVCSKDTAASFQIPHQLIIQSSSHGSTLISSELLVTSLSTVTPLVFQKI